MRKRRILGPIILTILLLGLVGGAGYWMTAKIYQKPIQASSSIAEEVKSDNEPREVDLKSLIHEAEKNVVQIEAKAEWGNSIGSGFLYNEKGDIITNAHVVKDSESIYVKTANARTYPAALIGIGKETDIAVIRVPQLANRTPMKIGENVAEVTDEIIAVGSPLGLQNTVTTGIISGTERDFAIDEFKYENVYQITAPITHGNSGGPLIHKPSGKVIAINSAGTEKAGIGFSIPLSSVMDQIELWSAQAENQELNYDGQANANTQIDPKQLKEDARYLYGYFNESLLMRDYINAYALLGSEWQSKQTYQEFRAKYVHTIDITFSNVQLSLDENNRVHISLTTDNVIRNSDQSKVTERYECTYTIGYENDQLKILSGKRELISSTPHETEDPDEEQENNSSDSEPQEDEAA
ncbi:S1C family serine protease [Pontibacillus sp. HMF3514]|uniref:S1C family serine protease n=1 Tax=Pontibacillus sp. HMF3514 TaxID=2692425 RepID=UPI0013204453|nr:trypsin-like peptidase domain-containing protein [Pontibacillus sp. HMF3514]QHE51983.1 trypsin-like serine protease [Pontibacillus sp. HMF3514]